MPKKTPTSFKLSDHCKALLKRLAALHGITATDVIEMAVRLLARRDLPRNGKPKK